MDIAALHIEPALPGVESATFTVGLAAAIDGQETSELTAKPAALARTALRVGTPDAGTRVNPMARFLDDFDWATDCPAGPTARRALRSRDDERVVAVASISEPPGPSIQW